MHKGGMVWFCVFCAFLRLTCFRPMRILASPTFAVLFLLAGLSPVSAQQEPRLFADECTFYLSFDYGDVNADIAIGDNKGVPQPKDKKAVFQPGLQGQALLAGGDSVQSVSYKPPGNFSYVRPGTLSLWLQPVKWKRGDALPPDPLHPNSAGYRGVTYAIFFMAYYAGGYMGIERMTPAYTSQPDSLLFWSFQTPKGPNSSFRVLMDWADGVWHHVVLTWRGQEITLYVDGVRTGSIFLKTPIHADGTGAPFQIGGASEPTLIDEVSLYSRALSEQDVKKLYASYKNPPIP